MDEGGFKKDSGCRDPFDLVPPYREYYDDVHRVCVPKPMEGEKLGLTVQQSDGCVVVTRSDLGQEHFAQIALMKLSLKPLM